MSRVISVDFETPFDTKEGLSIRSQGNEPYVRDPRCEPYLISVSDGAETWAGHPTEFNWNSLDGAFLISHNARFDSSVYKEMVNRGKAPKLNIPGWNCTANLSAYLCMRRDLLRAVEFLLGVSVDKSYRLDADGRSWEQMKAEGVAEKVKQAGRVDALRCHQIWTKYAHLWPEREKKLSAITIKQGQRGCQIDVNNLRCQLLAAQTALIQAESVLPWMKEGKKPTSPKAVAEKCREVGIPCPPVKSRDGEEAYDEWAAAYAPKHRWVKAYTDYRVLNKYIGLLTTIRERLDGTGIFSYDLLYFGAHTGRWAGAGGFNMQNMRSAPLYIDSDGWLVTDPEKLKELARLKTRPEWIAHVLDLRSLLIARPGKKMIVSDLSQIEPRVLAWIVKDKDMLTRMAQGNSPYQAHAEATMGWTEGDMKALIKAGREDVKDTYALAKARVLGLGYGCGWRKFITVAHAMAGLDITKSDPEFIEAVNDEGAVCFDAGGQPIMVSGYGYNSKRIVAEYRAQNPLITGLWKTLDQAFRDSVGGTFEMELPSGRKLRYPEVRRERKAVADPDNPKKFSHRWVYTALTFDQRQNVVVRKPLYGGLLTENLVQAIARDVFGEHLITLDESSGIDVLWSVHDEAVNEVDLGISAKDVEHSMSKTPDWIEGLPVAAEAKEVPCYCK